MTIDQMRGGGDHLVSIIVLQTALTSTGVL